MGTFKVLFALFLIGVVAGSVRELFLTFREKQQRDAKERAKWTTPSK